MLTKGMCVDWAKYGIQVNGIAPGYFETELNKVLVEDKDLPIGCAENPCGRWGNVRRVMRHGGVSFVKGFELCKRTDHFCRRRTYQLRLTRSNGRTLPYWYGVHIEFTTRANE